MSKLSLYTSLLTLAAAALAPLSHAATPSAPAIQIWSLRNQIKTKGLSWTLDQIHAHGITEVELAGSTYDLPMDQFKQELSKRNLTPISSHFGYSRFKTDIDNVVKEAKALGVKYVGCAWIEHKEAFDEAECRDAIAVFNKAGEALAKEGITFFYHTHGYEFAKHGDGTFMDLLLKETHPQHVSLEVDVFWVLFPGVDVVKFYEQYGTRCKLMHVKDMSKDLEIGKDFSGHANVETNVTLGTGRMDWAAIIAAAKKTGTTEFILEDESSRVLDQLPGHLNYLKSLGQ
jgi:sugar phosphate isomerase/epimerase